MEGGGRDAGVEGGLDDLVDPGWGAADEHVPLGDVRHQLQQCRVVGQRGAGRLPAAVRVPVTQDAVDAAAPGPGQRDQLVGEDGVVGAADPVDDHGLVATGRQAPRAGRGAG